MIRRGGLLATGREQRGDRPLVVPVLALAVGIAGGLASVGFRHLIELSQRAFAMIGGYSGPLAVIAVLMIPALGGLAVGRLIKRTAPGELAHGASDFMDLHPGERPARGSAVRRVVACALTLTTGGSAGCEGAVGQVGSAVGSAAGHLFGMPSYRVDVLSACGLAAAIGGLMQAPIAGFVFAGEIVLGGYAVRSVLPLGISSLSAAYLSRLLLGARPAFAMPDFVMVSPVELGGHLVVGVAAGVTTLLFMTFLERTGRVHDRLKVPEWLKPGLGGLVVGGIGLLWPDVRGAGYSTVGALLGDHLVIGALGALLLAKVLATTMTLGSGGAGGMFAPSLFAGASVGSAVGELAQRWWPQMTGGRHSYAILGMAAVLAATTRAPLTAIVFATELTGNFLVVFPVTVAVVASVFVSSAMRDETVQVIRKARRRIDALAGRPGSALHERSVADLLRPTQDVVGCDAPMAEVFRLLRVCRDDILIVGDPNDGWRVVGVVNLDNVKALMGERAVGEGEARDVMSPTPVLGERDALAQALVAFTRCHLPALPVVGEDGRLVGVITRYDVMDVCASELLEGYLGFSPDSAQPIRTGPDVELTPQLHQVSAVPVPRPFTGRTLREVDLVRNWGVACVGLRRANDKGELVPLPLDTSKPLRAGDVMILIGDKPRVDQVRLLDRASERPPP